MAFGTSRRSERAPYAAALRWLNAQGIAVESTRLDRLYSRATVAERFRGARFFFLPKKDVRRHTPHEWLAALREFVDHPISYLEEYSRREHSEAGLSADKRRLGWRIAQRRDDRIQAAD